MEVKHVTRSMTNEVIEHFEALPANLQEQVLSLVRVLDTSLRRGVSGSQLAQFAGTIPVDDLQMMSLAIEQGCEQVDLDEW
jgi:hypothetical protein